MALATARSAWLVMSRLKPRLPRLNIEVFIERTIATAPMSMIARAIMPNSITMPRWRVAPPRRQEGCGRVFI